MRWFLAALAAVLAGCPTPSRYVIERPGLTCERATRVAYRTMVTLGYTVTVLRPADPVHVGEVVGTRPRADGQGTETGRVAIRCGAHGASLHPDEQALFSTYEFSRAFDYSFKSLVQRPDVEEPSAASGLEVLVDVVTPGEAQLDLEGMPMVGGAVLVRLTVRNRTDRPVAVDPARIALVPTAGSPANPLTGAAFEAALAPGPAADRVRAERFQSTPIAANQTKTGFLVYPAGAYRDAHVSITDVETDETEGFVTPLQ
jgi:hypothetical protein